MRSIPTFKWVLPGSLFLSLFLRLLGTDWWVYIRNHGGLQTKSTCLYQTFTSSQVCARLQMGMAWEPFLSPFLRLLGTTVGCTVWVSKYTCKDEETDEPRLRSTDAWILPGVRTQGLNRLLPATVACNVGSLDFYIGRSHGGIICLLLPELFLWSYIQHIYDSCRTIYHCLSISFPWAPPPL